MKIDSGNALNYYGGSTNFDTHPDYKHDIFYSVQQMARSVGDIPSGKNDKFLDRAYEQNWWHEADRLADLQDKFLEDDTINNTPGRGARNYRRMEYDIVENPNGKSAAADREHANDAKVLTRDEMLRRMHDHVYALSTTASACSNTPITQKDYQGQIKLR